MISFNYLSLILSLIQHLLISYCLYFAESSYSLAIFGVTDANPAPGLEETAEGEEANEIPAGLEEWTAEGIV